MSSHAETIRRGLSEYDPEIDSVRRQHEALDALLAELEEWRLLAARQLEQFTVTTQKYRAENQQLREALEEACDWLDADLAEHPGEPSDLQLADRALIARCREALAGDAE